MKPALVLAVFAGLAACDGSGGGTAMAPPAGWLRLAQNPLLTPPKDPPPATTYELSIVDPSVLFDASDGRWKAWYSAGLFDRAITNDPGRIVIRYAESRVATWTPTGPLAATASAARIRTTRLASRTTPTAAPSRA